MKSVSAVVIAVLILHLQCAGSCLAESFGSTALAAPVTQPPPCHKHQDVPSNSPVAPQDPHHTDSPCGQGQGQLIEAKTALGGTHAQQVIAILPALAPVITLSYPGAPKPITENPPGMWSPPIPLSTLRI